MAKNKNKKSRLIKSLNSNVDTPSTFASRLSQWRDVTFILSIGLSILWIAKSVLMAIFSELLFKFTSHYSAVTLDNTNDAMKAALLITIALYAVFLIAWLQFSDDKLTRVKIFFVLFAFFVVDLFLLKDSVEFINRWQSTPLGEKVVYAYQFPEWKSPGKYHSKWHTCSYLMFEYGIESGTYPFPHLVTYPFPHPDQVSQGNVCIDVREGLLGVKWTEHIRSCKPVSTATNNQRAESSGLQTACKPSAEGMRISLGELKRFRANGSQRQVLEKLTPTLP
jgi:hypothetical protein